MRTRRVLLAAVATALLAAVASGCGSSDDDGGVARLDDGAAAETETATTDGGNAVADDPEEAALAWARCMREQGVDVPDPEVSNGRVMIRPGSGDVRRADPEKFRAAAETCGTPFGDAGPPQLSESERAALQETLLEFAECMRGEGIDMPDPDFSQGRGGGLFRLGGPGSGIDPDDPDFRAAQETCGPILQDALPRRGGGS